MASSFQYDIKELLINIDNINVSYNNIPILKNLSASIKNITRPDSTQGQVIGLLGPSGIGKTTLFRVLSGLMQPDSGEVLVGEHQLPVTPGAVGVVAQSYPLLNHRTILSNLVFAATQSGLKGNDAISAAKTQLSLFGLSEHSDKFPIQLSGGQRQRIAIAQQILCGDHYIIMDEPFSGLDVVALTKVKKMIQEVSCRNEDNTFIIVTHDIVSAVSTCDTLWLMGRDRDINQQIIPGARIMEVIDLINLDIAWHDEPETRPAAIQLIQQIKKQFLTL